MEFYIYAMKGNLAFFFRSSVDISKCSNSWKLSADDVSLQQMPDFFYLLWFGMNSWQVTLRVHSGSRLVNFMKLLLHLNMESSLIIILVSET